ncbi:hypothetical protein [Abyssalbus ytuae]|uniref:Uncharacterized protein n=1 Tax=Abyssalbus ytuae TaxID=2926907 RepID=A0A9E7D247_9FLAO|nr:hypothetical protein [Abyssalbus ytuae]UOB16314.1 hypothetical protein MQE35_11255 [Abyssalbus ytuae]
MRLLKHGTNFNWKYALGEIFLLFIGINLAIWFNNYNTNRQNKKFKRVAVSKIQEEIKRNQAELDSSYVNIIKVLKAFKKIEKSEDEVYFIKGEFNELTNYIKDNPGFFLVEDTTRLKNNELVYYGDINVIFDIPELKDIAWQTTNSINILDLMGYECLYLLEDMYNLQQMLEDELKNATRYLQKKDFEEFQNSLEFLI